MKANKLIAEFMGHDTYESNGYIMVRYSDNNERTLQDTHYHSSWNWLMPVVDKCFDTHFEYSDDFIFLLNDALLTTNIDEVYKAAIEFIKEYKEI